MSLAWGLNEIAHLKHLAEKPANGKHSPKVSYLLHQLHLPSDSYKMLSLQEFPKTKAFSISLHFL